MPDLEDNPENCSIFIAKTWSSQATGMHNDRTFMLDGIKSLVDEFINAYLSVNPR